MESINLAQKKLTNILREFDKLCRLNNIKYWALDGVLQGALLNNKWLPTDYTIKVGMLKSDYLIFREIADELPTTLWLEEKEKSQCIRDLYSSVTKPGIKYTSHNGLEISIHLFDSISFDLSEVLFEDIKIYIPSDSCILNENQVTSIDNVIINTANSTMDMLELYKDLYEKKTTSWFSRVAAKYKEGAPLHHGSGWVYMSQEVWDKFMDHCVKPFDLFNIKNIFEGGCGVGAALYHVLNKNNLIDIHGMDICKEAIIKCQEVLPMSKVFVSDICNLNTVESNTYDAVLSVGVLGLLNSVDDIKKAVNELIRIAKQNSVISLCVFTETNDGLKSFRQIVSKSWWHNQNFDVSSLITEDIPMDEFKNRYSVFMIKN